MTSLEEQFTEVEVLAVVQDIATNKAPSPNGYIGAFFKASWQTIKLDLLVAINHFYCQNTQHFKQLNSAHVILIPQENRSKGDNRFQSN